jgi:hypothetical protein
MLKQAGWLVLAACPLASGERPVAPSCSLSPGWTQDGPAREHTADNLFEYMNGNAEGYILYNFQQMRGVTCKQGETTFVIDISDMGEADYSYGLFTSNRDLRQPQALIGMGGQLVSRRLIFAKGRYYIEIAANPEGDHTAALKMWATALEKAVPGDSVPPAALAWFPVEKRQSLRLVPESVLGLRVLRRGYLAQYDYGKAFVAFEDSAAEAEVAMQQLRARFGATALAKIAEDSFEANDRYLGRLCVFRKGRHIGGYAVTGQGADPAALTAQLASMIP